MPVARFQLEDGRIARFEVADGTSPEDANAAFEEFFAQQQAEAQGTFQQRPTGEKALGVLGAGAQLVSGALAEPVAGLVGLGASILPGEPGAGARAVEATREALTIDAGEAGKQFLQESITGLTEKGKQVLGGVPATAATGAIDLQTQLAQQAAEAGNPGLATAIKTLPTAALEAVPAALGIRAAGRAATPAIEAFKTQSPTKQRIAKLIEEGSTDKETAGFKLSATLDNEIPRIQTDNVALDTIKQGFDDGVIAAIKGSSPTDKAKMRKMVSIMERGKKNQRFATVNRPSDVAGDSLLDRFRVVRKVNREAGKELDSIANSLRGQRVDSSDAVNSFIDDLDSLGVTLSDDFKPNFKGSIIEGLAAPEAAITRITSRLPKSDDAFEIHRMKKFIDENVTFGKAGEGLSGKTENVLKNFRRSLDETLDSNFPQYDRVNSTYSETIGAIDALQDVAGKKLNLTGKNADKSTGTLLRRTMSNAQSRIPLLDSIEQIEGVAKKFGGKFDDDLLTQVLFADELDAVFKPVARTSFQGQIGQAIDSSLDLTQMTAAGMGVAAARKLVKSRRKINEEEGFKAIKKLLKD